MLNRQIPPPVFILIVALAALLAVGIVGSRSGGIKSFPAPAIEGTTAAGDTFRLSDYKGKVVLLNFWATWCGPCRMEMPDLKRLQEKYGERGFTIVGLSTDDDLEVVKQFAKSEEINYPLLLAPPGVTKAFGGVPAIPATFLVDKNGNVVYAHEGLATEADLAPHIEKLL